MADERPYRLQLPGSNHAWGGVVFGSPESATRAAERAETNSFQAPRFRSGQLGRLRIIDRRTGREISRLGEQTWVVCCWPARVMGELRIVGPFSNEGDARKWAATSSRPGWEYAPTTLEAPSENDSDMAS